MPMLNYHPAPGLGKLLPGFVMLPWNPMTATPSTPLVASLGAAFPGQAVRVPRIGDLLMGTEFTIPENPILKGAGLAGLGCASCQSLGPGNGMAGISDSVASWVTASSPISGITNFVFYGALAGVGAYFMFFRHKKL